MNNPVLNHQQSIGSLSSRDFFSLSSQQVVLDTVKKVSLITTGFSWMKVFRIIPEFRILRLTFHRKSAAKC